MQIELSQQDSRKFQYVFEIPIPNIKSFDNGSFGTFRNLLSLQNWVLLRAWIRLTDLEEYHSCSWLFLFIYYYYDYAVFFVENILFINLFSLFLYFKTSLLLTIIDHSDFCSKWTNLYLSSMIFNHLSSIKLLFLLWSSSMISSPISMTTILSSKTHLWSLRKKHKHHPQLCRQPAA